MLTDKQKNVLAYVKVQLLKQKGFPSLGQIAENFGFSKNAAKQHIDALLKKGVLRKREKPIDHFELNDPKFTPPDHFELVANIAAGNPEQSADFESQRIKIDPLFFGGGEQKALRVEGESMLGDQISDGDIAIIKMAPRVGKNDIVALRVEGEGITLKRVKKLKAHVDLIPSNINYKTKRFRSDQVQVLGKLVGLIRKN